FLIHDRPIHMRCDDSVVRADTGASETLAFPSGADARAPRPSANGIVFLRRSRGYAPAPLSVGEPFGQHTLACGGELKSTFCLGREHHAFLSQHIGDLENYETLRTFREGITHFCGLFDVRPQLVAHDLHPDYLSTKYARELEEEGLPAIGVQHHHAHIAACLVDNDRPRAERVIGVALDGTGYGTDGAIWGGEFLKGSIQEGFTRVAHLEYAPLPGGAAAIREPWRLALARLIAGYGEKEAAELPLAVVRQTSRRDIHLVAQLVEQRINTPPTSSAGRLFDTVAALLDLPGSRRITYEGQAAVELELAASQPPGGGLLRTWRAHAGTRPQPNRPCRPASAGRPGSSESEDRLEPKDRIYPFNLHWDGTCRIAETAGIITGVVEDLLGGCSVDEIAVAFHRTMAALVVAVCTSIREEYGQHPVALSGGVFQNKRLARQVIESLTRQEFMVYCHRR
ncbi:MAG: hypothetical protein ACRDIE_03500, partial [Chloroflexota bacterium]